MSSLFNLRLQDRLKFQRELIDYNQLLKEDFDVILPPEPRKIFTPDAAVRTMNRPENFGWEMHYVDQYINAKKKEKDNSIRVMFHVLDTGAVSTNPYLNNVGQLLDNEEWSLDHTTDKSRVDKKQHFTHVAGIIAANHPELRLGLTQHPEVDKWAYIMGQKVLNDRGAGYDSQIARGAAHAFSISHNNFKVSDGWRHVFILSLGGRAKLRQTEKVLNSISKHEGYFIFAAAGNSGPKPDTVGWPAQQTEVFSVGALNQDGGIASYSSRGERVDFTALGTSVLSTYRDVLASMSGTSMATPMLGAMAGWILKYNPWILTRDQLMSEFRMRVVDGGKPGRDDAFGYGIVHLDRFINMKDPDKPKEPDYPDEPDQPDHPEEPEYPMPGESSTKLKWTFSYPINVIFRKKEDHDFGSLIGHSIIADVTLNAKKEETGRNEDRDYMENLVWEHLSELVHKRVVIGKDDKELLKIMGDLQNPVLQLQHSETANLSTLSIEIAKELREHIKHLSWLTGNVIVTLRDELKDSVTFDLS